MTDTACVVDVLVGDGMAIVTQGLRKRYRARIALDGQDLNVPRGRL